MAVPILLIEKTPSDDCAVLEELHAITHPEPLPEAGPSLFKMPASNQHGIEVDKHGFPIPASLHAWHAKNNK